MKKHYLNIVFIFTLFTFFIQNLHALEVTVYGSGNMVLAIDGKEISIKICPEPGDQACATLIIEDGVVKKIINLNKEKDAEYQVVNNLLKTYRFKISYPVEIVNKQKIEGQKLIISAAVDNSTMDKYHFLNELIKLEGDKVRFKEGEGEGENIIIIYAE